MADRTILHPVRPRFGVNEICYSRISATRGYVEPLRISNINFDIVSGTYRYSFYFGTLAERNMEKLLPITLLETELATLCEVLDVQISVLERELSSAREKLVGNCPVESVQPSSELPDITNGIVSPQQARFGYNEVVYLIESAQTTGVLEAMRIDGFSWDNNLQEWVYFFNIIPRPRRNATVGDRRDLRRGSVIMMAESQLCKLCEALPIIVNFYVVAVNRAKARRSSFCPSSGSE